ncbi:ABC transporter substrate-binding protein [Saccharopolyspora rectivirgula]|uniref:ABC transporter substrate-binding protein n=1 Tax=Saccharopolyspora rectivirgula TaxID=28042 RepID=A0A073AVP3_9PSEU|nr:ABC transporter substrate-binding protein [Saccharopolyspora rectivirgula]
MKLRYRWCVAASALVAAVFTTSCSPLVDTARTAAQQRVSVQAPTVRGGTAVVALSQEPDKLDPSLGTTLAGRQIFASMCEKLYDVAQDGRIVPQLAAALPQVSPDELTLTIPLRQNVRFNDGTPFDAAAVRKSLDRHRQLPASARKAELAAVETVEVVDPHTIRLRLSRPYAPLTSALADRAGMIMSPAQLDRLGDDFSDHPVCVGPFSFTERVAQHRIVLDRSPHYYDRDKVRLDRIIYRAVPDDNIRLANLRSGEFDVAAEISPTDVPVVSREKGLVLLNQPSMQYMGITVNVRNTGAGSPPRGPLASDERVRQALSAAIDRDILNKIAFNGLYQPACGPIPPVSPYATPKTQACPPHGPQRARQLLREAGVPTPVPVELLIPNDPAGSRIGQVVQAMGAEAGFHITLRPTEGTTLITESKQGNFQAALLGWSGRPDPDGNIADFHTRDGANNYSGHHDPRTEALIHQAAAETDFDRRRDLYEQIIPQLQRHSSVIYLYRQQHYTAHTDQLAGVQVRSDGLIRLTQAGRTAQEN